MKRASLLVVVAICLSACGGTGSSQPAGESQAAGQSQAQGSSEAPSAGGGGGGGGGGDGAALAEAAAAVTDWCTLMPADLVAELVPDATEPQREEFPSRCTASNGVQALQVSYQGFTSPEQGGAASIPGIAENAWLEPDYPVDDAYLTVILFTDPNSLWSSVLYVEMAGHDGVDHGDDAIAVAQAVIVQLR